MIVVRSLPALRRVLDRAPRPAGFVPTMGALHAGHLSLMRRSRKETRTVVVSIFVNPTQFGPAEDLARYPRNLIRDRRLAEAAGVDVLFVPSRKVMYPRGVPLTWVDVPLLSRAMCGVSRPGHFRGVATVVLKLLNMVRPDILYLGQKDAQQAAVVRRMIADLDIPVRLRVCPTVREPDGLAMSSRNAYLVPEDRRKAAELTRALAQAKAEILRGESDAGKIILRTKTLLRRKTGAKIDYIAIVSAGDLVPQRRVRGVVLVAAALRFPSGRIIDNVLVRAPTP